KAKVSEAVFVSSALFTLSLPPMTPAWIAVVGIVVGIVFGKMVFGGFGRNVFNPALVARCFIYVAFPAAMTVTWSQPFLSLPGGFAAFQPAADAITAATPIITFNTTRAMAPLQDVFLGFVNGSLGESSALHILLGGAYLLIRKVASWKLMLSTVIGGLALSAVLYYAGVAGPEGRPLAPPLFTLLSGGFLYGAVYMITDPVSAPKDSTSQWIAGLLVGMVTVVIRSFALFTEGIMFAILIVNSLTPLIELKVRDWKNRGKGAATEAAA
ncbi:MAG TPA: RnfABCDGE type electron transport complex subunit D, partial [Candidatus Limnocylindria bacterium]|nr:RnfABCDGE type electron transport complex subunit D [Candidatus Limnocylindria bacterium]